MIYRFVTFLVSYSYDDCIGPHEKYDFKLLVEHNELMALVSGGQRAREEYLRMRFGDTPDYKPYINYISLEYDSKVDFNKYGEGPYYAKEKYEKFSTLYNKLKVIHQEEEERSRRQRQRELEKEKREREREEESRRWRADLDRYRKSVHNEKVRNAYNEREKKRQETTPKKKSTLQFVDEGATAFIKAFLGLVASLLILILVMPLGAIPTLIAVVVTIVILFKWINGGKG